MSVHIEGERVIDAPRERVFAALTDPEVVAETVPLVESFEVKDADHWEMTVRVPLPMAKALKLAFEVVDKRPHEHATLRANGGGMLGGASVESNFDLSDAPGGTLVRFRADLAFRGALAPAERLLEPIAQRQAQKTLDAIERSVSGGSAA
jgi:carbon monoxide dehydrogenase subunit G